jgi:hypothetical protein
MVPQQALFFMNSEFVNEQARAIAARADVAEAKTSADAVQALYRAVLARSATPEELSLGSAFLNDRTKTTIYAQALLMSNEFSFLD